jgi:hypothetical protein
MKSISRWVWVAFVAVLFAVQTQSAKADPLDHWTTNQVLYAIYPGYYYGLEQVVYGNGIYVSYGQEGDAGGFFTSPDGYNWKFQYSEANSWGLPPLGYANGHYFGCAERGFGPVDVSADGTNWTTTSLSSPYNSLTQNGYPAMTYGNGLYVLAGDTNGVGSILTSPDGVTWTSHGLLIGKLGGPITSVAYGAGKFVAVGNNDGLEYTSTTGTGTWTKRSMPGGSQITFCGNLFLVPFTSNSNLVSADGINWTMFNTGLTNTLGNIIYSHSNYLAASGLYLATSANGTNWYQYPQPIPDNPNYYENLPPPHLGSMATDGYHLVKVAWENYDLSSSPYGLVYISDGLVGMSLTNNPTQKLVISGLIGRDYQIQSSDSFGIGGNWRTNATFQLTNTPFVWTDSAATNSMRFYRAVLLP